MGKREVTLQVHTNVLLMQVIHQQIRHTAISTWSGTDIYGHAGDAMQRVE